MTAITLQYMYSEQQSTGAYSIPLSHSQLQMIIGASNDECPYGYILYEQPVMDCIHPYYGGSVDPVPHRAARVRQPFAWTEKHIVAKCLQGIFQWEPTAKITWILAPLSVAMHQLPVLRKNMT